MDSKPRTFHQTARVITSPRTLRSLHYGAPIIQDARIPSNGFAVKSIGVAERLRALVRMTFESGLPTLPYGCGSSLRNFPRPQI
jgi:hypothetical protein